MNDSERPPWVSHGEIPSLHGFRALSILAVILSHYAEHPSRSGGWRYLPDLGQMGVNMFFVISGFLITLLLLRESARTGRISLSRFYLRRSLRILPAYLVYLVGVAVLDAGGWVSLTPMDWLASLTYTVSFLLPRTWEVTHIWSLSVEEHFYLLWPLVVCWLPRRAWLVAVVVLLVSPALRWSIQRDVPFLQINFCTLTRMDTLAAGCCLAYLAQGAGFCRLTRMPAWFAYCLTPLLLAITAVSYRASTESALYRVLGHQTVVAVCFTAVLWMWTRLDRTPAGRILNSRPLVLIGVLSYSLYLWQQPFFNPNSSASFTTPPWNLGWTLVWAVSSYVLIERPALAWKSRWSSG